MTSRDKSAYPRKHKQEQDDDAQAEAQDKAGIVPEAAVGKCVDADMEIQTARQSKERCQRAPVTKAPGRYLAD